MGGLIMKKEKNSNGNNGSKIADKNEYVDSCDNDLKKDAIENEEEKKNNDENENKSCPHNSKDEDVIDDYKAKLKEYEDRLLRLQADFDNYRKRVAKEREEVYSFALEEIMIQLLSVIDNFERALDSFKAGDLDKKYVEGLEMVYKNFIEILNKNGLSEIKAINCTFDPNFHHAVMQMEAEEKDENLVKEVFQKGYTLNSKVIRPSMVKVAIKN